MSALSVRQRSAVCVIAGTPEATTILTADTAPRERGRKKKDTPRRIFGNATSKGVPDDVREF